MRRPGWAWLALSSLLVSSLAAATRPRYGGVLAVELSAAWTTLDPSTIVPDASAESKRKALLPMIAETLVRLNERGEVEPLLALNWQHDAGQARWRFSLRPKVAFHDGEALNASAAAAALTPALKTVYGEVTVTAGGQTLVIQSDRALPGLLTELTHPYMAIFRKNDQGGLIGTGPFRVTGWEPGRRLSLAAFEDYWGGRPYLDSVTVNLNAARVPGDVFDIPFAQTRRVLPERTTVWWSESRELIALLGGDISPAAWQALSLSIDRAPIVNVLAQRRAETAFGLLPQWLSGYAFLFETPPDLARARQAISQTRPAPLALSYPANDTFARSVAERVALNAHDAGLEIRPSGNAGGNLRLIRWPLASADPAAELVKIAAMLGLADRVNAIDPARPETLYQAERALLDAHRVLPLIYLPDVYGLAPRVHNWEAAQKKDAFTLHLENVWVEP